jgi:hypothetical protein
MVEVKNGPQDDKVQVVSTFRSTVQYLATAMQGNKGWHTSNLETPTYI